VIYDVSADGCTFSTRWDCGDQKFVMSPNGTSKESTIYCREDPEKQPPPPGDEPDYRIYASCLWIPAKSYGRIASHESCSCADKAKSIAIAFHSCGIETPD